MTRIIQVHNAHVAALPSHARRRCWVTPGETVDIAPRHRLDVYAVSEEEGGPTRLALVLHSPMGFIRLAKPEDLGLYTTEALVRAVEWSADGVERVLLDLGELVTAPAVWAVP
jgi:hypothetical protein